MQDVCMNVYMYMYIYIYFFFIYMLCDYCHKRVYYKALFNLYKHDMKKNVGSYL